MLRAASICSLGALLGILAAVAAPVAVAKPRTPAPTAVQAAPCSPSLYSAPSTEMNEGTTNSSLPLRPGRRISAAMIFVDFPNLRAKESTTRLYRDLLSHSRAWFAEVSYGRVKLDVAPVRRWYRLPRRSGAYGIGPGMTFEAHRGFIADAVAAADATVDFSQFELVYVVAANGSPLQRSPAFHAYPGQGIQVDGTELRFAATFGQDVRGDARYASNVLVHETGHVLGLPDLYTFRIRGSGGCSALPAPGTS